MIQAYNPRSFSHSTKPVKLGKTVERWFLYLVVLGIAGVSLYWFTVGKGKEFEVSLTAKRGTVEYREKEGVDWKTVENIPLKINPSSEIRTMADSEASFSIADGSKVKLGSFSRIVLSKNQGEVDWVQTDGDSHHQTARNPERKSYKVSISDGDFEAIGTAFEVKIRDTETIALVFKDQLKIFYKDKNTAEARAGEKIVIDALGRKVKEIEDQDLKDSWTLSNLMNDQKNALPIEETLLVKAGLTEQTATDGSVGQPSQDSQPVPAENDNQDNTSENAPASSNNNVNINQETNGQPKINLQAKQSTNGVLLDWSGDQGDWESWKVLKGTSAELIYPNDSYRTVSKDSKSYLWEMGGDSGTYYFRVCAFRSDRGCLSYSNSQSLALNASGTTATETTNDNTSTNDTSDQTSGGPKKSGVTTRKKCEGSGGHWTQSGSTCKCPPGEIFVLSTGRCQKK